MESRGVIQYQSYSKKEDRKNTPYLYKFLSTGDSKGQPGYAQDKIEDLSSQESKSYKIIQQLQKENLPNFEFYLGHKDQNINTTQQINGCLNTAGDKGVMGLKIDELEFVIRNDKQNKYEIHWYEGQKSTLYLDANTGNNALLRQGTFYLDVKTGVNSPLRICDLVHFLNYYYHAIVLGEDVRMPNSLKNAPSEYQLQQYQQQQRSGSPVPQQQQNQLQRDQRERSVSPVLQQQNQQRQQSQLLQSDVKSNANAKKQKFEFYEQEVVGHSVAGKSAEYSINDVERYIELLKAQKSKLVQAHATVDNAKSVTGSDKHSILGNIDAAQHKISQYISYYQNFLDTQSAVIGLHSLKDGKYQVSALTHRTMAKHLHAIKLQTANIVDAVSGKVRAIENCANGIQHIETKNAQAKEENEKIEHELRLNGAIANFAVKLVNANNAYKDTVLRTKPFDHAKNALRILRLVLALNDGFGERNKKDAASGTGCGDKKWFIACLKSVNYDIDKFLANFDKFKNKAADTIAGMTINNNTLSSYNDVTSEIEQSAYILKKTADYERIASATDRYCRDAKHKHYRYNWGSLSGVVIPYVSGGHAISSDISNEYSDIVWYCTESLNKVAVAQDNMTRCAKIEGQEIIKNAISNQVTAAIQELGGDALKPLREAAQSLANDQSITNDMLAGNVQKRDINGDKVNKTIKLESIKHSYNDYISFHGTNNSSTEVYGKGNISKDRKAGTYALHRQGKYIRGEKGALNPVVAIPGLLYKNSFKENSKEAWITTAPGSGKTVLSQLYDMGLCSATLDVDWNKPLKEQFQQWNDKIQEAVSKGVPIMIDEADKLYMHPEFHVWIHNKLKENSNLKIVFATATPMPSKLLDIIGTGYERSQVLNDALNAVAAFQSAVAANSNVSNTYNSANQAVKDFIASLEQKGKQREDHQIPQAEKISSILEKQYAQSLQDWLDTYAHMAEVKKNPDGKGNYLASGEPPYAVINEKIKTAADNKNGYLIIDNEFEGLSAEAITLKLKDKFTSPSKPLYITIVSRDSKTKLHFKVVQEKIEGEGSTGKQLIYKQCDTLDNDAHHILITANPRLNTQEAGCYDQSSGYPKDGIELNNIFVSGALADCYKQTKGRNRAEGERMEKDKNARVQTNVQYYGITKEDLLKIKRDQSMKLFFDIKNPKTFMDTIDTNTIYRPNGMDAVIIEPENLSCGMNAEGKDANTYIDVVKTYSDAKAKVVDEYPDDCENSFIQKNGQNITIDSNNAKNNKAEFTKFLRQTWDHLCDLRHYTSKDRKKLRLPNYINWMKHAETQIGVWNLLSKKYAEYSKNIRENLKQKFDTDYKTFYIYNKSTTLTEIKFTLDNKDQSVSREDFLSAFFELDNGKPKMDNGEFKMKYKNDSDFSNIVAGLKGTFPEGIVMRHIFCEHAVKFMKKCLLEEQKREMEASIKILEMLGIQPIVQEPNIMNEGDNAPKPDNSRCTIYHIPLPDTLDKFFEEIVWKNVRSGMTFPNNNHRAALEEKYRLIALTSFIQKIPETEGRTFKAKVLNNLETEIQSLQKQIQDAQTSKKFTFTNSFTNKDLTAEIKADVQQLEYRVNFLQSVKDAISHNKNINISSSAATDTINELASIMDNIKTVNASNIKFKTGNSYKENIGIYNNNYNSAEDKSLFNNFDDYFKKISVDSKESVLGPNKCNYRSEVMQIQQKK